MGNIQKTVTIDLPDNHKEDELVEAILFLRVLSDRYPQHLDIAYEALQRVYNIPPMQIGKELNAMQKRIIGSY